jgi:hypothetical protein
MLRWILWLAFSAIFFVGQLDASIDRGAIQGTVTDQQGAVVAGATVTIKNVDTNVETTLKTNTAGFYLATGLVPGKYVVRVLLTGFSALEIANVAVTAGTTFTADAQLKVGSTTQQVQVTAAAPLVETTASNFSTEVQSRYIADLPLPGRDIQGLVQLFPGVTQSTGPSTALFGFNSQFAGPPDPLHLLGSGISANGSQSGANAWYLDGSLNAALGPEAAVVNPSPDAVSEFAFVDNGLAAEWGRTSGAVVNVVLKSGANQLHGNTYEFNRNSWFSATNPFAQRDAQGNPYLQPSVNFNNFGGTLGGPVYIPHVYNGRNRTFFFVSEDIQFFHERKPTVSTVPLPAEAQGNFTGDPKFAPQCGPGISALNCLYDPNTTYQSADGTYHRDPFPTPVIPTNRIDPLAAWYLSTYPAPNYVDPLQQGVGGCGIYCNNYLGTVGSSQTTHNFSLKIDHEVSGKNKLFSEWLFNPTYYQNFRYPWNGPTAQTQTGIAGAQPYRTINQIGAVGLTSTLSATLVNEVRFNFSRQNQIATPNGENVVDNHDVLSHVQGLNFILFPPFQVVPDISIGGIGGFGPQQWQNAIQGEQAYTFLDNVTKILGKHTLKTGLMWRRDNAWNVAAWGYGLGFGGGLTDDPVSALGGSGLAQFLLGAVDQGSGTGEYHSPWQTNDYWGFYGQDDFRVSKNLSLNFGLRYDIFGWFRERHNDIANFDANGINPLVPFPGRIDYVGTSTHPARSVFPAHKNDLGPRLAFAWTPLGDRKTVIRGGFGIIYSNGIDTAFGDQLGSVSGPAFSAFIPYNGDFSYQRPAFQLSSGAPNIDIPPLDIAKTTDDQFLGTSEYAFSQGSKDPYVEQWSLFIERELPANMALNVGYVGSHGEHLYGDITRSTDYVPTATRLQQRYNIDNGFPTDPSIGAIYGCGTSCAGYLVLKPYPQYTNITPLISPDGYNRYNSFQMKLEKRYAHGLNFFLAYTIQKNMESANLGSLLGNTATPSTFGRTGGVGRTGAVPGASAGGAGDGFKSAGAEDPDDRRRYAGLAPDDIPQVLNLAATYELPFGAGKPFLSQNKLASKVVGGWKLMQNWNFQSGVPMLINSLACNAISCRPNLIGNPAAGRSSKNRPQLENQWYNPAVFEAPFGSDPAVIQGITTGTNPDGSAFDYNSDPYWTFGNIGLRPPSARAPGYWNADMTLAKEMHFTEGKYFQLRWEVFNALNHQNLGIPNNSWCLPPNSDGTTDAIHIFGCQFGKITNVQTDPRGMEFGLKFYW